METISSLAEDRNNRLVYYLFSGRVDSIYSGSWFSSERLERND